MGIPPVRLSYFRENGLISVAATENLQEIFQLRQGSIERVGHYRAPDHCVILQAVLTRDWQEGTEGKNQFNVVTLGVE